ncbi:MAG TPA: efflux RND transporter periplasmic adaptor subunit [Verrucomicrobiae bacterium]|nr:efflux RND transporter periplasmic adaptor subunit [Verrucomicrobiae bacterium]
MYNRLAAPGVMAVFMATGLTVVETSCRGAAMPAKAEDGAQPCPAVSVVKAVRKDLQRNLTVSSELVPFQQIDLFAKEAGFVHTLNVDYGTHVHSGQVLAVLEIPELQMQLDEDDADIADATDRIGRAQKELDRVTAQRDVLHLQFTRLDAVAKSRAGLVAQQEVDDSRGRDLAAEAQVEGAESALESARSQLAHARAKRRHDQTLFDYSKIIAPFDGVVTQRYANLGALMQSGTNSSTQATPLVQLSEDDLFRLVIPVPESYVRYIRTGDPVDVRIPSLNTHFPGRVKRLSFDVQEDTRTMHTEVDVPNPRRQLMPGMYADATLVLDSLQRVVAIPLEAVNIEGERRTVWAVDPSGKVEIREVTLGIETPDEAEVVSGVNEGEMLAVGSRGSLTAGEKVCPKEVQLIRYHGDQP